MNPTTRLDWGIPTPLPLMTPGQEVIYLKLQARSYQRPLLPYHPSFPYIFEVTQYLEFNVLGDTRFYCLQCDTEWLVTGIFRLSQGAGDFIKSIERAFAPHAHPPEDLEILDPSGVPLAYETIVG